MYANLPRRPQAREVPIVHATHPDVRLFQLAIGWNVPPELRAIVRLTARFRSVVLRELFRIKSRGSALTWTILDESLRAEVADMVGKDHVGQPLEGHRHTEFLAWCENDSPTRLLVWRESRPFDQDEQRAILAAASRDVSWSAAGAHLDDWKVRLIPLDSAVTAPPGFDDHLSTAWESMTPYVPPRHHLRRGQLRATESPSSQVKSELSARGFPDAENIEVEEIGVPTWVAVHTPRRQREQRQFLGDKRGYSLRIKFPQPVRGPLRLGHSASFGLGLFKPVL